MSIVFTAFLLVVTASNESNSEAGSNASGNYGVCCRLYYIGPSCFSGTYQDCIDVISEYGDDAFAFCGWCSGCSDCTGACCGIESPNNGCYQAPALESDWHCEQQGGQFRGLGSTCCGSCGEDGACCGRGGCAVENQYCCDGIFGGVDSACNACEDLVDLNGDGFVTLDDYALFSGVLEGPDATAPAYHIDLNKDGHIDLEDFAWLQEYWN